MINCKEYCCKSDQLQGILLSNLMSAVISSWLRTMAKRAASSINRFWGDVPEISHKYLQFKTVTQGRARFCKIPQNCDTRLSTDLLILQNCFKTVTQGRLLLCSLLKAEGGVALVHLRQGQVLGTQWRRCSQIAGLQDASDSHEVVLGSWQAVRERRTLRYTASERKLLLTKTRKCSNRLESTWLCEGSMSSFRVSTLTAFWWRDNIFLNLFIHN